MWRGWLDPGPSEDLTALPSGLGLGVGKGARSTARISGCARRKPELLRAELEGPAGAYLRTTKHTTDF